MFKVTVITIKTSLITMLENANQYNNEELWYVYPTCSLYEQLNIVLFICAFVFYIPVIEVYIQREDYVNYARLISQIIL